jgi:hypothetical protein
MSNELQTLFVARLEEVFRPLRDLVASVQGWTDQVLRPVGADGSFVWKPCSC